MQYIIIAVYIFCSVSGLICFKLGSADILALDISPKFFSLKISWLSVLGLVLYIISFLIYMGLISRNNLSYVGPVTTGVVYLLLMIFSVVIFKETIQPVQIVGGFFIFLGLILMNIQAK